MSPPRGRSSLRPLPGSVPLPRALVKGCLAESLGGHPDTAVVETCELMLKFHVEKKMEPGCFGVS